MYANHYRFLLPDHPGGGHCPEENSDSGLRHHPETGLSGSYGYFLRSFSEKIKEGAYPTISRPAIGEVDDVYRALEEETPVLPIGDGLSGTYQNMESAKSLAENTPPIEVLDSKTLAGPLWHLVQRSVQLRNAGVSLDGIRKTLRKCAETSASFVIPRDINSSSAAAASPPWRQKWGRF